MARFNAATLEVKDLNEDMAISTMKRNLRRSRFIYSLDKTLFQIYAELLEHVYKYIRTDEATSDRRQTEDKGQKKKNRRRKELRPNQVGHHPISELHPDDGVQGRVIEGMTPILFSLLLVRRYS